MNLDGIFRSSELSSDLLIEHARDSHPEDIPLLTGQRLKALLQLYAFLFLFTPGAVPLQCEMNRIQEIQVAERLGQEFDCPRFHCADAHRNVTVAGNEHYRNTNVSRRKLALKIQSAQSTQPNVQHKATGRIRGFSVQEAF